MRPSATFISAAIIPSDSVECKLSFSVLKKLDTENSCSLLSLCFDLHLKSLVDSEREVDVPNLIPETNYAPGLAGEVDPDILFVFIEQIKPFLSPHLIMTALLRASLSL